MVYISQEAVAIVNTTVNEVAYNLKADKAIIEGSNVTIENLYVDTFSEGMKSTLITADEESNVTIRNIYVREGQTVAFDGIDFEEGFGEIIELTDAQFPGQPDDALAA